MSKNTNTALPAAASGQTPCEEESALAQAQSLICNAMRSAGISKAELARRIGCSRAFITQSLGGDANLTVKTMARFLAACGAELGFNVRIANHRVQSEAWAIFFEDASMEPELFTGEGAELAARARFEQLRDNWNCSLFGCVDTAPQADESLGVQG